MEKKWYKPSRSPRSTVWHSVLFVLLVGLSVLNAGGSLAQDQICEPATGEQLSYGDNVYAGTGSCGTYWFFYGSAGDRVVIEMSSREFDTYLELLDNNYRQLAYHDDVGGGSTDSRLEATLRYSGEHIILARGYDDDIAGHSYTLSLRRSPAQAQEPACTEPVGRGILIYGSGSRQDRLTTTCGDVWHFYGRRGDRVQIVLEPGHSPSARIELADPLNNRLGEGETRIEAVLSRDGTYSIYVLPAYGYPAPYAYLYSLTLNGIPAPTPTATPIPPTATPVCTAPSPRGTLAAGIVTQNTVMSSECGDAWTFSGGANDRVVLSLRSAVFDPYLELRSANGSLIAANDNHADSHARIETTLTVSGSYTVYALGRSPRLRGLDYTLYVEVQPLPPSVTPVTPTATYTPTEITSTVIAPVEPHVSAAPITDINIPIESDFTGLGIAFGVPLMAICGMAMRSRLRHWSRGRAQINAVEGEPPQPCQYAREYCTKRRRLEGAGEIQLKHYAVTRLHLSAYDPRTGRPREHSVDGGIIRDLNDVILARRMGQGEFPLQQSLRSLAARLDDEVFYWLQREAHVPNRALYGELEGSEVTYTFTRYRCQKVHGVPRWKKIDEWEVSAQDERTVLITDLSGAPPTSLEGALLSFVRQMSSPFAL